MKLDEFKSKEIQSVKIVMTVLTFLNQGRELNLGGTIIRLGETHGGGFQLMTKTTLTTTSNPTPREHWLGLTWDLSDFTSICAKLSEDEVSMMMMNIALQESKKKRTP